MQLRVTRWSLSAALFFVAPVSFGAGFTIAGATVTVANSAQLSTTGNLLLSNGKLVANQSNIVVGGNWTNTTGTFTAGTSTVAFNGAAAQTINNNGQAFAVLIDSNTSTGGVTFASSFTATSLTVNGATLAAATTIYFNANSTFTLTGLTLAGSSGKPVWIRSGTPTQPWFLNNTSTNTVSFVDVQDSSANAGVTIVASSNSVDSGRNVNWTFLILSVSLSTHSYNFGTVNLANTTVSTLAVTVTNGGNTTETYSLSVATTGAQTVWGVKVATPTTLDKFVLFGLFNSVQPSSNTFLVNDVILTTPTASTASIYKGDQSGLNTAIGSSQKLWMRLDMPLTTSTTVQQQMNLTVTASSP
jgi:hypothetical protein